MRIDPKPYLAYRRICGLAAARDIFEKQLGTATQDTEITIFETPRSNWDFAVSRR